MPSSGWGWLVRGSAELRAWLSIARILASEREAQHDVGDDAGDGDVEPERERSSARCCGAAGCGPRAKRKT